MRKKHIDITKKPPMTMVVSFFYHCPKQDVKLFEYTGVYRVALYKNESLSAKKLSENRIS